MAVKDQVFQWQIILRTRASISSQLNSKYQTSGLMLIRRLNLELSKENYVDLLIENCDIVPLISEQNKLKPKKICKRYQNDLHLYKAVSCTTQERM